MKAAAELEAEFIRKEFAPLVGATIVAIEGVPSDDSQFVEVWPVLVVRKADGTMTDVVVSCDPEGNGPGFLFIEPQGDTSL